MKWLAPMLVLAAVLLQLTAPDGTPVWFNQSEIIAISSPATCSTTTAETTSRSRVMTSMGSFCVRESVEQVVKKFQAIQ